MILDDIQRNNFYFSGYYIYMNYTYEVTIKMKNIIYNYDIYKTWHIILIFSEIVLIKIR